MRTMEERRKSSSDFKEGEVRILIATDVAARGIDIRELPFVINVTLPDLPQTYWHRAGRVGRANRLGLAVSLVATVDKRVWYCKKGTKQPCKDTTDYDKEGKCEFLRYADVKIPALFYSISLIALIFTNALLLVPGNCIWYRYSEPKCRSEMEKLLDANHVKVSTMVYKSSAMTKVLFPQRSKRSSTVAAMVKWRRSSQSRCGPNCKSFKESLEPTKQIPYRCLASKIISILLDVLESVAPGRSSE